MSSLEVLVRAKNSQHASVEAFRKETIGHSNFQTAKEELLDTLNFAAPGSVIALVGPTGAGKSRLAALLAKEIAEISARIGNCQYKALLQELFATDGKAFSFSRDIYRPALQALNAPSLSDRIDAPGILAKLSAGTYEADAGKRASKDALLRDGFLTALREHSIGLFLLDDAHHIRHGGSGATIKDRFCTLKSLAGATSTRLVLIGTGELKEITRQTGQNSRRSNTVFFLPYSEEIEKDRIAFASAVKSIIKICPFRVGFEVSERLQALFQGSLGAIGILHEWFQKALQYSISRGETELRWASMQRTVLQHSERSTILREILEVRQFLALVDDDSAQIQQTRSSQASPPAAAGRPSSPRKPGERKPKRDSVPRKRDGN